MLKQNSKDSNWSHGYKYTCFQHPRNPCDEGRLLQNAMWSKDPVRSSQRNKGCKYSFSPWTHHSQHYTLPSPQQGQDPEEKENFTPKTTDKWFFFRCALINLTVRLTNIKWMKLKRKKDWICLSTILTCSHLQHFETGTELYPSCSALYSCQEVYFQQDH